MNLLWSMSTKTGLKDGLLEKQENWSRKDVCHQRIKRIVNTTVRVAAKNWQKSLPFFHIFVCSISRFATSSSVVVKMEGTFDRIMIPCYLSYKCTAVIIYGIGSISFQCFHFPSFYSQFFTISNQKCFSSFDSDFLLFFF